MMIFCGTALNRNVVREEMAREAIGQVFGTCLFIFMYVMAGLTFIFLMLTAAKDNGIVLKGNMRLRTTDDSTEMLELEGGGQSVARRRGGTGARYCEPCGLDQPPRVHHCHDCGVCIYRMDHHCPWMGKCVGRGNMSVFVIFNCCWLLHLSEFLFVVCAY